jgi:hypothetical protein
VLLTCEARLSTGGIAVLLHDVREHGDVVVCRKRVVPILRHRRLNDVEQVVHRDKWMTPLLEECAPDERDCGSIIEPAAVTDGALVCINGFAAGDFRGSENRGQARGRRLRGGQSARRHPDGDRRREMTH